MPNSQGKFAQYWCAIRQQGRSSYVIKHGVLLYGTITFLLYVVIMAARININIGVSVLSGQGLASISAIEFVFLFFCVGLLGGVAWGVITWAIFERYFKTTLNKDC